MHCGRPADVPWRRWYATTGQTHRGGRTWLHVDASDVAPSRAREAPLRQEISPDTYRRRARSGGIGTVAPSTSSSTDPSRPTDTTLAVAPGVKPLASR